jgi:hypothetical protein
MMVIPTYAVGDGMKVSETGPNMSRSKVCWTTVVLVGSGKAWLFRVAANKHDPGTGLGD